MLRKLQQRSTFSCTNRTKKKKRVTEAEVNERRRQSSTGGSVGEPLIRVWNVLMGLQNGPGVCVLERNEAVCKGYVHTNTLSS